MPVGIDKTDAGLGGLIPQQNLTGYTRTKMKSLFFSEREVALLLNKTLRGGFGSLEIGTVLAEVQGSNKLVPYVPAMGNFSQEDVGRVMLLNDCNTTNTFDLAVASSYKIQKGDTIILTDTDGTYEEATVGSVDRESYDYKAVVTLSSGNTSNSFTTAKNANCYVKSGTSNSHKSDAVYILDQSTLTGVENQDGALTSVLVSNAIIYQSACVGMDSYAKSDLSVTSDGEFYILK